MAIDPALAALKQIHAERNKTSGGGDDPALQNLKRIHSEENAKSLPTSFNGIPIVGIGSKDEIHYGTHAEWGVGDITARAAKAAGKTLDQIAKELSAAGYIAAVRRKGQRGITNDHIHFADPRLAPNEASRLRGQAKSGNKGVYLPDKPSAIEQGLMAPPKMLSAPKPVPRQAPKYSDRDMPTLSAPRGTYTTPPEPRKSIGSGVVQAVEGRIGTVLPVADIAEGTVKGWTGVEPNYGARNQGRVDDIALAQVIPQVLTGGVVERAAVGVLTKIPGGAKAVAAGAKAVQAANAIKNPVVRGAAQGAIAAGRGVADNALWTAPGLAVDAEQWVENTTNPINVGVAAGAGLVFHGLGSWLKSSAAKKVASVPEVQAPEQVRTAWDKANDIRTKRGLDALDINIEAEQKVMASWLRGNEIELPGNEKIARPYDPNKRGVVAGEEQLALPPGQQTPALPPPSPMLKSTETAPGNRSKVPVRMMAATVQDAKANALAKQLDSAYEAAQTAVDETAAKRAASRVQSLRARLKNRQNEFIQELLDEQVKIQENPTPANTDRFNDIDKTLEELGYYKKPASATKTPAKAPDVPVEAPVAPKPTATLTRVKPGSVAVGDKAKQIAAGLGKAETPKPTGNGKKPVAKTPTPVAPVSRYTTITPQKAIDGNWYINAKDPNGQVDANHIALEIEKGNVKKVEPTGNSFADEASVPDGAILVMKGDSAYEWREVPIKAAPEGKTGGAAPPRSGKKPVAIKTPKPAVAEEITGAETDAVFLRMRDIQDEISSIDKQMRANPDMDYRARQELVNRSAELHREKGSIQPAFDEWAKKANETTKTPYQRVLERVGGELSAKGVPDTDWRKLSSRWHDPLATMPENQPIELIAKQMDAMLDDVRTERWETDLRSGGSSGYEWYLQTNTTADDLSRVFNEQYKPKVVSSLESVNLLEAKANDVKALIGETGNVKAALAKARRLREMANEAEKRFVDKIDELRKSEAREPIARAEALAPVEILKAKPSTWTGNIFEEGRYVSDQTMFIDTQAKGFKRYAWMQKQDENIVGGVGVAQPQSSADKFFTRVTGTSSTRSLRIVGQADGVAYLVDPDGKVVGLDADRLRLIQQAVPFDGVVTGPTATDPVVFTQGKKPVAVVAPRESPPTIDVPTALKRTDLDAKIASTKARIKENVAKSDKLIRSKVNAGIDPEWLKLQGQIVADYARVGVYYVGKGLTEFAEWQSKMIAEFGDKVKPHLNDIWANIQRDATDAKPKATTPKAVVAETPASANTAKAETPKPVGKGKESTPNNRDYIPTDSLQSPLGVYGAGGEVLREGVVDRIGTIVDDKGVQKNLGTEIGKVMKSAQRNIDAGVLKADRRIAEIRELVTQGVKTRPLSPRVNKKAKQATLEAFVDIIERDLDDPERLAILNSDTPLGKALKLHDEMTDEFRDYIIESRRSMNIDTPDDWGITEQGYFRHLFLGDFQIRVGGRIIDTAPNYAMAQKRLSELMKENPSETYSVTAKQITAGDPALRISTKQYFRVVNKLTGEVNLTMGEVMDDIRGIIGRKAAKQKFFGALLQRTGAGGYSKAYAEVMKIHAAQMYKSQELSKMVRAAQPKIEELRKYKPGLAERLEQHIKDLWGTPTTLEKEFGNLIRATPYLKDNVGSPDLAMRGLAGKLTGLQFNLKLRFSPRAAIINRLQPYSTLWPFVTTKDFMSIALDFEKPSTRKWLQDRRVFAGATKYESTGAFVKAEAGSVLNPMNWFQKASEANRGYGYLYGYKDAIKRGFSEADAHINGLAWAELVEFDNSTWNTPAIIRSPQGRVLGQFRGFQLKNLENLREVVFPQGYRGGIKLSSIYYNIRQPGMPIGEVAGRRAKWGSAQLAVGGVKSLGVVGTAIGGYKVVERLSNQMQQYGMDKEDADKMAEAVYYGAPSLIGQDLSMSVGILEAPFGNSFLEQVGNVVLGPTVGSAANAAQAILDGNAKRALNATTSLGKPIDVITQAIQNGSLDETTIKTGNNQTEELTSYEATMRGLGFTPVKQSRVYDKRDAGIKKPKAGPPKIEDMLRDLRRQAKDQLPELPKP